MKLLLNKKLSGLTLIELVVAMVISSIAIMLAFTCYQITYKQYLSHRKNSNEVSEAFLLNALLKRDAVLSVSIMKIDDNTIQFKMNDSVNVTYVFESIDILRSINQLVPDTFKITAAKPTVLFNSDMVPDNGLVDDLVIKGFLHNEPITFTCYKEYGADILMQQLINKE